MDRIAPKVPGFAGSAMSVVRPAIKSGQWRTSAKQKQVMAVKPGVGLTGGEGNGDLGKATKGPVTARSRKNRGRSKTDGGRVALRAAFGPCGAAVTTRSGVRLG